MFNQKQLLNNRLWVAYVQQNLLFLIRSWYNISNRFCYWCIDRILFYAKPTHVETLFIGVFEQTGYVLHSLKWCIDMRVKFLIYYAMDIVTTLAINWNHFFFYSFAAASYNFFYSLFYFCLNAISSSSISCLSALGAFWCAALPYCFPAIGIKEGCYKHINTSSYCIAFHIRTIIVKQYLTCKPDFLQILRSIKSTVIDNLTHQSPARMALLAQT